MSEQVHGVYRRRVGDWVVTALNDGYLDPPIGVLANMGAEEATALLHAGFRASPPRLTVHAFLLQGGGRTVLVDAGAGGLFGPSCGRMMGNLAAAGVSPGEVDTVLMTHLHGDHFGGLVKDGQAVFGKAALVVPEVEAAYWLDGPLEGVAEESRGSFEGARAAVEPYTGRMQRVGAGEVLPGVGLVPLPGHTPGHSGYMLGEGSAGLLIWGDIIHVPAVQSVRPEATVGFDVDPALATSTRKAVMARAAAERLAVAGMHLDFPTFCHLVAEGEGYRLVPDQWVPVV